MVSYFVETLQPCAIVSIILSGSVLLTSAVFPDMIRRKIFMQLVVMISVADILGNWPYTLSFFPANGTTLCSLESFCDLYFFPVSWLLTTMLTKLFHDVLVKGNITMGRVFIFSFSFGLPLLLVLGFFYSSSDPYVGYNSEQEESCTFSKKASLYHIITYNGVLFFCSILMLAYLYGVLRFEMVNKDIRKNKTYNLIKRVLILYPFALIICWVPHAACLMAPQCIGVLNQLVRIDTVKILHGGLVGLIFFGSSSEAINNWYYLFFPSSRPAVHTTNVSGTTSGKTSRTNSKHFSDHESSRGITISRATDLTAFRESNLPADEDIARLLREENERLSLVLICGSSMNSSSMTYNSSFHSRAGADQVL